MSNINQSNYDLQELTWKRRIKLDKKSHFITEVNYYNFYSTKKLNLEKKIQRKMVGQFNLWKDPSASSNERNSAKKMFLKFCQMYKITPEEFQNGFIQSNIEEEKQFCVSTKSIKDKKILTHILFSYGLTSSHVTYKNTYIDRWEIFFKTTSSVFEAVKFEFNYRVDYIQKTILKEKKKIKNYLKGWTEGYLWTNCPIEERFLKNDSKDPDEIDEGLREGVVAGHNEDDSFENKLNNKELLPRDSYGV